MAFSIGCYLRETAFKLRQQEMDMTKSMLNNISSNTTTYSGGYSSDSAFKNPYKIDNPYSNGEEDISWLI